MKWSTTWVLLITILLFNMSNSSSPLPSSKQPLKTTTSPATTTSVQTVAPPMKTKNPSMKTSKLTPTLMSPKNTTLHTKAAAAEVAATPRWTMQMMTTQRMKWMTKKKKKRDRRKNRRSANRLSVFENRQMYSDQELIHFLYSMPLPINHVIASYSRALFLFIEVFCFDPHVFYYFYASSFDSNEHIHFA